MFVSLYLSLWHVIYQGVTKFMETFCYYIKQETLWDSSPKNENHHLLSFSSFQTHATGTIGIFFGTQKKSSFVVLDLIAFHNMDKNCDNIIQNIFCVLPKRMSQWQVNFFSWATVQINVHKVVYSTFIHFRTALQFIQVVTIIILAENCHLTFPAESIYHCAGL